MKDLTLADWLGIIAIAVAIIAVPVTIALTRRFGERRRKLLCEFSSTALISEGQRGSDLLVQFRGAAVADPFVVTVTFENVGPTDITTAHFDGGRPVAVEMDVAVYGILKTSYPTEIDLVQEGVPGYTWLHFLPALLPKGGSWEVELLTGGAVEDPVIRWPLIDTDRADPETVTKVIARSALKAALRQGLSVTVDK